MADEIQRVLRTEEPYMVLAVSTSVSAGQIRHAYHRLAKQLHPDRNKTPGAEEAFKRVSAAHQLLTDDARRCRALPPLRWRAGPHKLRKRRGPGAKS